MVDLLGPGDAGAINTLATTTDVSHPVAGDTWFQDCVGGDASSGTPTPIDAKWLNWMMQQDRAAIRFSNVPLGNAYDYMLSWAIQSGFANFIGYFGGTYNFLTGDSPNAPQSIQAGTLIRGIATLTNNAGAHFDWSGLGSQPIVRHDGSATTGGEIVAGDRLLLMWDGSAWVLMSPYPISWLLPQLTQIDIQTFDSSGTWTKPAGFAAASRVIVRQWGGGGGGVGGLGGAGGAYDEFEFYLDELPGTAAIVVGAGGTGSDNSSGAANAATQGGSTFFAYGLYGNAFVTPGGPSVLVTGGGSPNAVGEPNFVTAYRGAGGIAGNSGSPYNGGNSIGGGAGGAGWNGSSGSPGSSVLGGGGGAVGAAGSAPGGGGGAGAGSGTPGPSGGSGGHGRVIVITLMG